jgi:hypothetical protein
MHTTYSVTRHHLLPDQDSTSAKYFLNINGRLMLDSDRVIGQLKATRFMLSSMVNDRESWAEHCDHSQLTHDVWFALCGPEDTYEYRSSFDDVLYADILLLESIEIVAEFRGHKLGLAMVLDAIQMFDYGCGAIVIEPHPIRYGSDVGDNWHQAMQTGKLARTDEQCAEGAKRLRKYWAKLNFKSVPKSKRFMYRRTDLAYKDPKFDRASLQSYDPSYEEDVQSQLLSQASGSRTD